MDNTSWKSKLDEGVTIGACLGAAEFVSDNWCLWGRGVAEFVSDN